MIVLKGHNIREELLNQLNKLPSKLDQISEGISQLSLVKDYYKSFLKFTLNK
jgi:hypothetical protein